jgi:hypothetical protein
MARVVTTERKENKQTVYFTVARRWVHLLRPVVNSFFRRLISTRFEAIASVAANRPVTAGGKAIGFVLLRRRLWTMRFPTLTTSVVTLINVILYIGSNGINEDMNVVNE